MPAFRFFDPWSAIDADDENPPATPAKVAKAAKADEVESSALAGLAALATAPAPSALAGLAALATAPVDNGRAISFSSFSNCASPFLRTESWSEAEDECAAIVEHDGKIPGAWAEGFARFDPDRPPAGVPLQRWKRFLDDVRHFLDNGFAVQAAALGWGPYDLFGCDRDRPFARIDQAGLLWLLNGDRLIALSETTATIQTRTGARHTFHRRPSEPGRVLAWELAP
jgi:hypothetical protein